jgi:hypothetical protein
MVDTGVYTDLVHDGDTGLLGLGIELHHCWGDVGGCDDVLLLADRGLDDGRVVCVGDEGDYDVDLGDFSVESVGIVDIELGVVSSERCMSGLYARTLMALVLEIPLARS